LNCAVLKKKAKTAQFKFDTPIENYLSTKKMEYRIHKRIALNSRV
jgi:hypothetical protein